MSEVIVPPRCVCANCREVFNPAGLTVLCWEDNGVAYVPAVPCPNGHRTRIIAAPREQESATP